MSTPKASLRSLVLQEARDASLRRFYSNNPSEIASEIGSQLAERGALYRLSEARYHRLRSLQLPNDRCETRISRTRSGHVYYDRTLTTIPHFVVLDEIALAKISKIGKSISTLIDNSVELLSRDEYSNSIATSACSERPLPIDLVGEKPSVWLRIDFQYTNANHNNPVVIDINLNPGITFINEELYQVFNNIVQKSTPNLTLSFCTRPLTTHIARGKSSVGVLVRRGHGLYNDMALLHRRLLERGAASDLIEPDQIYEVTRRGIVSSLGTHDVLARMFREVSKHGVGADEETERVLFNHLREAARAQWIRSVPPFCLGLEDHAWSWIWRAEAQRSWGVSCLGSDAFSELLGALPRSALIREANLIWDDGELEPLTLDSLRDKVVKSGESTGAREVFVLRNSSQSQRQRTLEWINNNPSRTVVQELVRTEKELFPIPGVGEDYIEKPAIVQYSAYFSTGVFMGLHALICPSSYKCHGGSASYHVPVAIFRSV